MTVSPGGSEGTMQLRFVGPETWQGQKRTEGIQGIEELWRG